MRLPRFVAAFLLFLSWQFMFFEHNLGNAEAHTVTFYVHNKCPFGIWPAIAPNNGYPVLANGGFYLPSGQTRRVIAPWKWTGRLWARTGCNFATNWSPACQTGDCDGQLECNGLIGTPPVTLVQISVQIDQTKPNYYDVSLVDGYNLPVSVSARPTSSKCTIGGCVKSLNSICPEELKMLNDVGEVVACRSGCLRFDLDSFCCRNEYGSPDKCGPSVYSKLFKEACPSYYSYAYDSPPPLASCTAKDYVVTFCPSTWGHGNSSVGSDVAC